MASRLRLVLGGAVILAALPIWTLPIALIGVPGFGWYLGISNALLLSLIWPRRS